MDDLIIWLERQIEVCDDIGGMGKEKWAFIQTLKKVRKEQTTNNMKEGKYKYTNSKPQPTKPKSKILPPPIKQNKMNEEQSTNVNPTCDVCGSTNTISTPHMGTNCLDCHPLNH